MLAWITGRGAGADSRRAVGGGALRREVGVVELLDAIPGAFERAHEL